MQSFKVAKDMFYLENLTSMLLFMKVDDFYTYGNVEELQKYMKKAQTLNTKLALCKEKIEQVMLV